MKVSVIHSELRADQILDMLFCYARRLLMHSCHETQPFIWAHVWELAKHQQQSVTCQIAPMSCDFTVLQQKRQNNLKILLNLKMIGPDKNDKHFLVVSDNYKTVIQAENVTPIGWFVYSSQHSNLNSLMSHLAVKTGYEWGYKLGACTASDSMVIDPETDEQGRTQWKDGVKALFIYVPHDKAMPT